MDRFPLWARKLTRRILIDLGTVAVSLPILGVCLLVTVITSYWLGELRGQHAGYVSRRVILLVILVGGLGSALLDAWIIYRVNHFLENRFKRPE